MKKIDRYSKRSEQLSIALQVEEDFDLLFERELNDLDAPCRAQRDENQIYDDDAGYQYLVYGDDADYQYLADWITE